MKKTTFDSIKMNFFVVDETFTNLVEKEFTINLVLSQGTVQFETTYPDYIYNEAKRLFPDEFDKDYIDTLKSESQHLSMTMRSARPKTIRYDRLEDIKGELWSTSLRIETVNTFKDNIGDKMLFIKFNGRVDSPRSWSGGGMGLINYITFQYFVGYRLKTFGKKHHLDDKEQEYEKYSSLYKMGKFEGHVDGTPPLDGRDKTIVSLHHTDKDMEKLKNEFVIIPWTEEREQYLKDIQTSFTIMTDKLNEFLKDLTEIKLDHLIENKPINKLLSE